MLSELVLMLSCMSLGLFGAAGSFWLRASGKAACALALTPLVGVWLTHEFC